MSWINDEAIESIEIRPKDKVLKLNGKDFGKRCEKFSLVIKKDGLGDFEVSLTTHMFHTFRYDGKTGQKKSNPKETDCSD